MVEVDGPVMVKVSKSKRSYNEKTFGIFLQSQTVLVGKEKSALVLGFEFWQELECMNPFTLRTGTLLFKAASVKVVLLCIKSC